ncbi:MAG: AAA family ATPase [Rhodospirillales bacterium]|nr:AAA family ATPase [Rhodospirillales bacterium]
MGSDQRASHRRAQRHRPQAAGEQLGDRPVSGFAPSPAQSRAIADIQDWFDNRTDEQQVFRVFGYAGSGKTSITKHAIAELGLDTMAREPDGSTSVTGGVLYGAFTGKAALVMSRKGTPASTIHSLIYRVSEATQAEIDKVKKDIAEIKAKLPNIGPSERLLEESRMRSLELRLADIHKPRFVLNEQSIVHDAKLIVLDEVSMVGEEMARDLLAFGKPILVLGDPGQLPPIKGQGAFTQAEPDVMLTEIHRQAGESAIIRLATMARQGHPIPYGEHDDYVWKMRRDQVGPEQMLRGGQVICGRNATRVQLNLAMKHAAGFDDDYPSGAGEKIICLKNRNDIGIVNGMFLEFTDIRDETASCFSATVLSEDGEAVGSDGERHFIYKGHFDEHVRPDPERDRRDHWIKKGLIEAVWGYAITCHKSQGSQWENVLVFDDGLGRTAEDRARWLYTAITRAEKGLVILD